MKRLFILLSLAGSLMGCRIYVVPTVSIKDDVNRYTYFYVPPTAGVSSNFGGIVNDGNGLISSISTINPAELINGYLMQHNYNVLFSILPEVADSTIVVMYGVTEKGIILQMKNAKTQELVASYQVEGYGVGNAAAIRAAIYTALEIYQYSLNPRIETEFLKESTNKVRVLVTNKTPDPVNTVVMRFTYYKDGEVVCEQENTISQNLYQGDYTRTTIKRIKAARSPKYQIKAEVVEYK